MRGSFPEGLGLQQVVDIYKRSIRSDGQGAPPRGHLAASNNQVTFVPRPHIGSMVQKTERPQDPC
jgi:hypothetical protein